MMCYSWVWQLDCDVNIVGAFALYDIDGDGHISRDEMVNIITAIYEMVGPEPNTDGVVVSPEAKANQIFDNMDFVCISTFYNIYDIHII